METKTKVIFSIGALVLLWGYSSASAEDSDVVVPTGGGGAVNFPNYGTYQGTNGSLTESYLGMKTVRGIRNNNAGNIKTNAFVNPNYVYWNKELKKADNSDGTFCQFETFAYGLRAMIKLLKTYKTKYSIDTIDALISRWDKPTAQSYKDFVSGDTGIQKFAVIDLHDKETLKKLVIAMVKLECAGFVVSSAQFETAYSIL